jgi:hypothetical protein
MGYRSDVTAAFYVKDAKHLPILKIWLTANFPMDTFHNNIRWFDRGIVLTEESVKWYESYDEVVAFDEAVGKYLELVHNDLNVEADAPSFAYEFVRIGEDDDDVETKYEGEDCEWLLGVHRSITCEV